METPSDPFASSSIAEVQLGNGGGVRLTGTVAVLSGGFGGVSTLIVYESQTEPGVVATNGQEIEV